MAATNKLDQVKEFIVLLSIAWTRGENSNFGYATSLLVRNDSDEKIFLDQLDANESVVMGLNDMNSSSKEFG